MSKEVIVIDADDLMADPRGLLKKYCAFVGLKYDDSMLDWSNETNKPDKPWEFIPPAWTCDLKETNSFRKSDKIQDKNIEYPQIVEQAIADCVPWYEKLYQNRELLGNYKP